MTEKRCSIYQGSVLDTPSGDLNQYAPIVSEAIDICENRLTNVSGNFILKSGSIYQIGSGIITVINPSSYVNSITPLIPTHMNIDAYNEIQTNPEILDYINNPGSFNWISSGGLYETKYCFECEETEAFGDPLDENSVLDPVLTNPDPDPIDENPIIDPPDPCPPIEQLSIDLVGNYNIVTFNGLPLSKDCCTPKITGINNVIWSTELGCHFVDSPCPPQSTLTITQDNFVLGIDSEECCTESITGIPGVYWDPNAGPKGGACKVNVPIPCEFQNITLQVLNTTPPIEQVFGETIEGDILPLSEECCTNEIAGFDVMWDTDLRLCKRVPPEQPPFIITLNEEPIIAEDCDDLLVSVWLYFTQPSDECLGETISAVLLPDDPSIIVEQIGTFDSDDDGFNTWVGLTIRLTNTNNPFNINLSINNGLVNCCEYDIRFDDIRVDCYNEEDRIFYTQKDCPGFDLTRVIDNKKSWVYNPGIEDVGIGPLDAAVRDRGDIGLIQGYGTINRTFAPSADADIPWRYTDYYVQSNILEKHSNLVLNSKEMELTFNMCSDCSTTGNTITLLELEKYKKVFQSFWVTMIEQFVPATTIFVSGERWCNNDKLICSEIDECDYDYEYVDSEITVIEYGTDFSGLTNPNHTNGGGVTEQNDGGADVDNDSGGEPFNSDDGAIITDGTVVIPTQSDGGLIIVEDDPISRSQDSILTNQRNQYLATVIKEGEKTIFE